MSSTGHAGARTGVVRPASAARVARHGRRARPARRAAAGCCAPRARARRRGPAWPPGATATARAEQRARPRGHEVGGQRDAGHRQAGDGPGVGVRAVAALPGECSPVLGRSRANVASPGPRSVSMTVSVRPRRAAGADSPATGRRSAAGTVGRRRKPTGFSSISSSGPRPASRRPGAGRATRAAGVARTRPRHRPAEDRSAWTRPVSGGRGVPGRRAERVEQQQVGRVVAGDVVHRRVVVHDREGVPGRPAVRLVEAGAQHRPARGSSGARAGAAGELGQHQARGDRRGERRASPARRRRRCRRPGT